MMVTICKDSLLPKRLNPFLSWGACWFLTLGTWLSFLRFIWAKSRRFYSVPWAILYYQRVVNCLQLILWYDSFPLSFNSALFSMIFKDTKIPSGSRGLMDTNLVERSCLITCKTFNKTENFSLTSLLLNLAYLCWYHCIPWPRKLWFSCQNHFLMLFRSWDIDKKPFYGGHFVESKMAAI